MSAFLALIHYNQNSICWPTVNSVGGEPAHLSTCRHRPRSKAKLAENAETFPLEIKRGSITVKSYRTTNDGKPEYTLIHYNRQGERKRETTRNLEALKARAEEALNDLSAARSPEIGALTAAEREEFMQLKAIFSEIKATPLVVARHFVESVKVLGCDLV